MATRDACFGDWRPMSHLHSNSACAESQSVSKGCSSSRGAKPLQDFPHTPCLCLATLHISSWVIYILLLLSHVKQASCLPLSLFLLNFSEICLSSVLPRNLTERDWWVEGKNDTLKGETIAAGTVKGDPSDYFHSFSNNWNLLLLLLLVFVLSWGKIIIWRNNASWHTSEFPLTGSLGLKCPSESCWELTVAS